MSFLFLLLYVHLVQMDLQKLSWQPDTSSVCQAAGWNRGKAFQMNSEQTKDDWERGVIQNCLLSQDLKNLWSLIQKVRSIL